MANPRDAEDLEDSFDATLGRIESEVGKILEGSLDIFDPDASMAVLDEATLSLQQGIAAITAIETASPCSRADLASLAESAIADAVAVTTYPIVVSSTWNRDIPSLDIPSGGLDAILGILARRTIDFAGKAGQIYAETRHEDDFAIFSVSACPHGRRRHDHEQPDIHEQLGSVCELIDDLGGNLGVTINDDDQLRVDLVLPLGIRVSN